MSFPKFLANLRFLDRSAARRGRFVLAGGLGFISVLSWAARPSYEDAQRFGYELQASYAERHMNAILDKLDDEGMARQMFSVFGVTGLESNNDKLSWNTTFLPTIRSGLTAYESLETLVFSRVLWLDGRRALECVLLDARGNFQVLTLWLNQKPNGTILIDDYRTLGSTLEITRRLRHVYLLIGAPFSAGLSEEEQDLAFHSENHVKQSRMAMDRLGQNRYDEALTLLMTLPEQIRTKRIWLDIRNGIALAGCEPALAQVMDEYRRGRLANRFLRFVYARNAGDAVASLKALEALIEENYEMAFLRVQRAELLVEAGQAGRALALAREIYELNPFSTGAYFAAIHAAAALRQPAAAVQALQRWNLLMPVGEIDKLLRAEKSVEDFVGTADYARWREQAAAAVTAASTPKP